MTMQSGEASPSELLDEPTLRWCIDRRGTKIHEQGVGVGITQFGETLQFALPNILPAIYEHAVDELRILDTHTVTGLRHTDGADGVAKALGMNRHEFDLVQAPRQTLTLEFGARPHQFSISEDLTLGREIDIDSNDIDCKWPKGAKLVKAIAQSRGVRIPDTHSEATGRKVTRLLSRLAARELGTYSRRTRMPAIVSMPSKRGDGAFLMSAAKVKLPGTFRPAAPVSAPLRNMVDLINLSNFQAHIFGEAVPFDNAIIDELLRRDRCQPSKYLKPQG